MKIAKKLTCGMMAALMIVATAAPADAKHRRHRDRDRDNVDAGDVIGAAVLIGGIAALAGAFKGDRYGGRYGAEKKAIKACVREAEGGEGAPVVREIEDVEQRNGYYFVRGVFETGAGYREEEEELEGFSCTVRGKKIYDFQRSGGYHW